MAVYQMMPVSLERAIEDAFGDNEEDAAIVIEVMAGLNPSNPSGLQPSVIGKIADATSLGDICDAIDLLATIKAAKEASVAGGKVIHCPKWPHCGCPNGAVVFDCSGLAARAKGVAA